MSFPYYFPDKHECPDCGGEADNSRHPCSTLFTCECGFFFDTQVEKEREAQKKYGFNWFTTYSRSTATGGVS